MFEIDVDRFKVLKPWRDPAFWIAVAAAVLALLPTEARTWLHAHQEALVPVIAYLVINGAVRVAGVTALGRAVAGSKYVDVTGDRPIKDPA